MSLDAYDVARTSDDKARCNRKSIDNFMGLHRKPCRSDEAAGFHVVELLFGGGRLLFVKEDKDWCLIVRLG